MELYNLLDQYDRILHLDADIIINKDIPDLFDVVPIERIASVYEDKGSRVFDRLRCIGSIQAKYGSLSWTYGYINTGVFLVSKCHKSIFQKIRNEYWEEWGCYRKTQEAYAHIY